MHYTLINEIFLCFWEAFYALAANLAPKYGYLVRFSTFGSISLHDSSMIGVGSELIIHAVGCRLHSACVSVISFPFLFFPFLLLLHRAAYLRRGNSLYISRSPDRETRPPCANS